MEVGTTLKDKERYDREKIRRAGSDWPASLVLPTGDGGSIRGHLIWFVTGFTRDQRDENKGSADASFSIK